MDKAKEMQSCTVSDIQSEIKSLKAIISNNRRVVSHSITDTSLPSGKATLPEWQLDTSVGKNTLIETKEE